MKFEGSQFRVNASALFTGIGVALAIGMILSVLLGFIGVITHIDLGVGKIFLWAIYFFAIYLGGFYTGQRGGKNIACPAIMSILAVLISLYLYNSQILFDNLFELIMVLPIPFIGWWRGGKKTY